MDKTKDRYYVRFVEKTKETRLPLCKARTVMRVFFRCLLGSVEYLEIINEAYLDKRVSKMKRDKNGNLVRGFSESRRQELFGTIHDTEINQFREGLSDPETSEGYTSPYGGLSIQPMDEDLLVDTMSLIELINEDRLKED